MSHIHQHSLLPAWQHHKCHINQQHNLSQQQTQSARHEENVTSKLPSPQQTDQDYHRRNSHDMFGATTCLVQCTGHYNTVATPGARVCTKQPQPHAH